MEVVAGGDISQAAYNGDGEMVNSDYLNGLSVESAKEAITARLVADGAGQARVEYKLRDWLFARQRYWGEPFPIVYDDDGRATRCPNRSCPSSYPTSRDYAPVLFDPDDADSVPSPPLNKATDWVHVELDLGDGLKTYTRDTNVMPQWAGSSWYELRYTDPHNSEALCDKENEAYWMGPRPAEHGAERPRRCRPVRRRRRARGAASAVLRGSGTRCSTTSATCRRGSRTDGWSTRATSRRTPTPTRAARTCPPPRSLSATASSSGTGPDGEIEVFQEFGKIGKSLKNSVSPDEICDNYGADTLRVYEMSMGPLEASRPWATKDVVGAYRFLQRVWRLVVDEQTGTERVADARGAGRRDAAGAAPHDRRGVRRLRGAAQQHRRRQADRVHQSPDQAAA